MDLRKTLTLFLALFLVVGLAYQADAVEGDPAGWGVAVVSPDSAGWAGIGDSVIVTVKRTTTIGDSALAVFVGLYTATDTVSTAEVAAVQTATTATLLATAGGTGVAGAGTFNSNGFLSADLTFPSSTASGIQTYRFAFGVDPGDAESVDRVSIRAQAFINHGTAGLFEWKQLTNTSTASQFDVAGSALNIPVGDNHRFGIDGQRPDNTKITAVSLTLPDIFKITGTDTLRSAGLGDVLTANIEVSGVGSQIARADVYVQDAAQLAYPPDSAFATYSFDLLDLVAGPATKGLTLAAGSKPAAQAVTATQNKKFPNGKRVIAVAHLVDRAGNVSSTNVNDSPPVGFSNASIVYVVDTTVPVITLTNPDSSGDYVTGRLDTVVSMVQSGSPAAAANVTFTANPIEWKVSEGTKSRFVTDGTDTAFADSAAASTAAKKFFTKGTFTKALGKKPGVSASFTFAATDSVGNKVTKAVSGVTYDEVAPGITIFPSNSSLGQTSGPDTINAASAQNPVINYTEAPDSVSIRYIEVGGAAPSDAVVQAAAANKLTTPGEDVQVVVQDTFLDGSVYSLQVLVIDKAGNANATLTDTLLYDKQFQNPITDSFKVIAAGPTAVDSQLVGADFTINITAIDSAKNRLASGGNGGKSVTYKTAGVRVTVTLAEADAAKLGQVKLSGTGVDTVGLYGTGVALLDAEGWTLGARSVKVKSEKTLDAFTVSVSDTSGGITRYGQSKSLYIDATEMSKYAVTVTEDGVAAEGVSGEFGIWVVPTDQYGNASMKASAALDTRTTALKEIFAEISSNKAQVLVPQGPQPVVLAGSAFTGVSNASGDGLVITVLTSSVQGDTSGAGTKQLSANGKSASTAFAAEGEEPVVVGAPAAPDSLIVQDYLGADGQGDQGGFVLVSFPNSEDHASVTTYRLYREVSVTTGLDSLGNLTTLDEAVDKWISWVTIDAAPVLDGADAITQAVVPTLDGVPSNYAIAAEKGRSTSDATVAGKRVFTKANVQQMVKLLGVDPNRVYSNEELSELFTPSADYVKSIIGDQNLQFATLDPDIASLVGSSTVPQSIRTEGAEILSSQKTLAAGPVKAVDNIPPAQISGGAAVKADGKVTLTWNGSADDRVVAYSSYRGFAIPIPGVDHYVINRGLTSSSEAAELATVPAGTTSFVITNPLVASRVFYRIDAVDLDNVTLGPGFTLESGGRIIYAGSDGKPVYIIITSGAATPFRVDFEDFLKFVGSFNQRRGAEKYDAQSDLDDNGVINFNDFLLFAGSFNKTAVTQGGTPVASTKPVIMPAGQNDGVTLSLGLKESKVLPGQLITLDVTMAGVEAMVGFGLTLNYDDTKFEFVEAAPAAEDLLKSGGAETPVFLHLAENGSVTVANAMDDAPVGGEGSIVSLTFKVLGDFEDAGRFDISDAVVFDGDLHSNPVVVLGSLELQTTPTEFALLQNYPNPFNPETTIKYNLAEGAGVSLRIYNIVGQVVRTLVAETQTAGRYQVRWDGTDDRGSSVSSGIYFYQVAAGQFKDVKRLMLLK